MYGDAGELGKVFEGSHLVTCYHPLCLEPRPVCSASG